MLLIFYLISIDIGSTSYVSKFDYITNFTSRIHLILPKTLIFYTRELVFLSVDSWSLITTRIVFLLGADCPSVLYTSNYGLETFTHRITGYTEELSHGNRLAISPSIPSLDYAVCFSKYLSCMLHIFWILCFHLFLPIDHF